MTRAEAVKQIESLFEHCEAMMTSDELVWSQDCEALKVALFALRGPTREQVEKVWRGEWVGMTDDDGCTWYECSRCEYDLDSLEDPNHFCPNCGAPMTDKAVETIMKRMEEMRND